MTESSSPNLPAPAGFASKAESGNSNVNVSVGTAPNPESGGDGGLSRGLKDYWPMLAFLIGAIFSAGVLWQKVNVLEKQQETFRAEVQKGFENINDRLDTFTLFSPMAKTDDF